MPLIKLAKVAAQNTYLALGLAKICEFNFNQFALNGVIGSSVNLPDGLYEWVFVAYAVFHFISAARRLPIPRFGNCPGVGYVDLPGHGDAQLVLAKQRSSFVSHILRLKAYP